MKINYRYYWKNKWMTLLNILGLTIGLSSCFAVVYIIHGILNVDHFHENKKNLYQLVFFENTLDNGSDAVSALAGPVLKENMPVVKDFCRFYFAFDLLMGKPDNFLKQNGYYADQSAFSLFTFPLVAGNKDELFKDLNTIVISEKLANKLFGTTNVVSKNINIFNIKKEKPEIFTITGVFKDVPFTSTLKFEFLINYNYMLAQMPWVNDWGPRGTRLYLLTENIANLKTFSSESSATLQAHQTSFPQDGRYQLSPFINRHIYDFNGRPGFGFYMTLCFSMIGVAILLISIINFINMSTIHTIYRSKEIAVKKVNGAGQSAINTQLLLETSLLVLIAAVAGYFVAPFMLEPFEQETEEVVILNAPIAVGFLLIVIVTIAGANFYPSLYLNRISPAAVFRKNNSKLVSSSPRLMMVMVQFTLAVIIITASVILWQQNRHLYTTHTGLSRDGIVSINCNQNILNHRDAFVEMINKKPEFASVSFANQPPINIINTTKGISWEGKSPQDDYWFAYLNVGGAFSHTFNIKLKQGRDFAKKEAGVGKVIINEKAAEIMQLEVPLGKIINFWGTNYEIIGVVENFNFQHLSAPVLPLILRYSPEEATLGFIRLAKGHEAAGLASLEHIFKEFAPEYPFEYTFLDDVFDEQHKTFKQLNKATNIFGLGAIVIACIGLLGIIIYSNEKRTKEIGIRKINGASVLNIALTLSRPYLVLISISLSIAFPLAYLIMEKILKSFATRITISLLPFAVSSIILLTAVFIFTGWHMIKMSRRNPVEALRYE